MAEYNPNIVRAVAIEAQECILDLYLDLLPLVQTARTWNLHCINSALPQPFDVKIAVEQYQALKLRAMELRTWIASVKEADPDDGYFDMPTCPGDVPTETGGIIFLTPGLAITSSGLLIPSDTGLTISTGSTIPSDTGLIIPSATGDGIAPPEPPPEPTPDVFQFEFFGPVVAGNTQSLTIPAMRVAEIELTTTSQASDYTVTFNAQLNGVSVLLGGAHTQTIYENYSQLPVTKRMPWNYWLVSPELTAGTLTVSITSTSALVQHFVLKIIR